MKTAAGASVPAEAGEEGDGFATRFTKNWTKVVAGRFPAIRDLTFFAGFTAAMEALADCLPTFRLIGAGGST